MLNFKIPLITFSHSSWVTMNNSVPLDCLHVSDAHGRVWW